MQILSHIVGDLYAGGNPLVCVTELVPCCAYPGNRHGEWYYPNGTSVPPRGYDYYFYRDRREAYHSSSGLGEVRLHRRYTQTISPIGIYGCVIPGADGVNQNLYVGLYTSEING